MRVRSVAAWTNPSVRAFAQAGDPLSKIIELAQSVVLRAQEEGWSGPPFDPFDLARRLNIRVVPSQDVPDARLVSEKGQVSRIDFNPERPRGRLRYSVAHEIAHTLFPDCAEQTRHRASREQMRADEWQLEMLCNVAASEMLMPIGSFPQLRTEDLGIEHLMELRRRFDVSAEALLLRAIRITEQPCLMFAARATTSGYTLDYFVGSRTWPDEFEPPLLGPTSVAGECTAIGYTAKGEVSWGSRKQPLHVECVGIPPYPGEVLPRIVGIARQTNGVIRESSRLKYVTGSALEPRGEGPFIIAQIVNDKTPNWGGGFSLVIRKKWPNVQSDFVDWVTENRKHLSLGQHRMCAVDTETYVFSMVAQHGYGASQSRKVRYEAIAKCLAGLSQAAKSLAASVHMPRIGCGEGGGLWSIIGELIDEHLCGNDIAVTIYDLPGARPMQASLFSNM